MIGASIVSVSGVTTQSYASTVTPETAASRDKVVCPFCTNEGSGLANSISDIDKLIPTAKRTEGLAIKGSQVENSGAEFEKWVAEF